MLPVAHRHAQRPVLDIHMLLGLALRHDPQRIPLEILGQRRDLLRHRR